ncbi:DUF4179 domain-containing protein [Lysinibacillus antri]|uniref:DUF4030 domain-containing protein n=1 Tax=Lysinibacillus antri TaxID=2498145 RepID=A0A3S0R611_9BACI|nr:DUF4179 domain-containing protein [Lysinibacillus antri]RUL51876.1 DUF4030 domain-containing protein [Lysinibacillus antri]
MKVDNLLKKGIEKDMEQIKAPLSLYTFAENIKEENMKMAMSVKVTNNAKKKKKRNFKFISAAIVGIGILTGSAFLNPSMAEMASKIPYLGQVFKQKPATQVMYERLLNENYQDIGITETPGDVVNYEVRIKGATEEVNRERENITSIVESILESRGYDNYKITVKANRSEYIPLTEEEKKMTELASILEKELKLKGYDIIGANPFDSEIEIRIPATEMRVEEIKADTFEIAKMNGINKSVKLDIIDTEVSARQNQWMNYLSSIGEGLASKKEFKVTNYGFSYKNQKMKIFIYTSMNQNDSFAKETVVKIKKEIQSFLSSEEVRNSIIGEETYELHITDKKKQDFQF